MRILSVRLSVRPSVKRVNCDKTTEKITEDFYTIRKNIYPILRKRMDGVTPSTWNFGSTDPRWSEIAHLEQIIARSASTVTPSKTVQFTLIGSPLRAFPMSLRWSSYVVPKSPKGGSKTKNGRFSSKIALRLKNAYYKVSLCENCQQQIVWNSLDYPCKNYWWGRPLLPEILGQSGQSWS